MSCVGLCRAWLDFVIFPVQFMVLYTQNTASMIALHQCLSAYSCAYCLLQGLPTNHCHQHYHRHLYLWQCLWDDYSFRPLLQLGVSHWSNTYNLKISNCLANMAIYFRSRTCSMIDTFRTLLGFPVPMLFTFTWTSTPLYLCYVEVYPVVLCPVVCHSHVTNHVLVPWHWWQHALWDLHQLHIDFLVNFSWICPMLITFSNVSASPLSRHFSLTFRLSERRNITSRSMRSPVSCFFLLKANVELSHSCLGRHMHHIYHTHLPECHSLLGFHPQLCWM